MKLILPGTLALLFVGLLTVGAMSGPGEMPIRSIVPSGDRVTIEGAHRELDPGALSVEVSRRAAATGNLLVDAGFEEAGAHAWTSNPAVTRSFEAVHHGSAALRNSANSGADYVVEQNVGGVDEGFPYVLSGWVNVPAGGVGSGFSYSLGVNWLDGTGKVLGKTALPEVRLETGGWQLLETVQAAPLGTRSAVVELAIRGLRGTFYVDDLYLGNDLFNGGFELEDDNFFAAGWSQCCDAERVSWSVKSGRWVLLLKGLFDSNPRGSRVPSAAAGLRTPGFGINSRPITGIVAGQTYHWRVAVCPPGGSDYFGVEMGAEWRNDSGNVVASSVLQTMPGSMDGCWRSVGGEVVAPAGATQLIIGFGPYGDSGFFYVDDVAVWPEVPGNPRLVLPLVDR